MKRLRALLLVAPILASANASAWNGTGHMVIAEVALLRLDPEVSAACDRLLKIGQTKLAYDFVTAAPWADDIRNSRRATGSWHFINLHFRTDGKPVINEPEPANVVTAIVEQSHVLQDRSRPELERADALRYLIHFVGDLHQPLHATARDSEEHPKGDRGGNDFRLAGGDNLHSFWDRGAGLFPNLERPLNALSRQLLSVQAKTLMATIPVPSHSVLEKPPMDWAKEGLAAAKSTVYQTSENVAPNADYTLRAQALCARKAAIAGYRLSSLLNHLF